MENDRPTFRIAIVSAVHIQPSKEWVQSLQSISSGKSDVSVIIVDDSDGKVEMPADFDVYDYARQQDEMGEDLYKRFGCFHKSPACKNFGHWIAWRDKYDIVIGLDSDCIVPPNFIGQHIEALMIRSHGWTNPIKRSGWFPHGYPYAQRDLRTVLSLGLWAKELDLYGKDRLENKGNTSDPMIREDHEVADGVVPLSGMNWACWAEAIPGLLFLPDFDYMHGEREVKFRRHDGVWGGYIFQKMMALRNERIVYGTPIVSHDTVVDAQKDAEDDEAMIQWENLFYGAVDQLFAIEPVEGLMYEDMMEVIAARSVHQWLGTEWWPVAQALELWFDLFNQTERK